jgi:hypothetical protein
MPTVNDCRYRGKGDELGLLLGQRRGLGGKTPSPSLNPRGRTIEWRIKMERKGK